MGFVRLLIIGAVIWLAFRLLKRFKSGPATSKKNSSAGASKKMVQCKQCGLHIPVDEALPKGDDYYCCSDHREQS
jgi:uncharacterized protein